MDLHTMYYKLKSAPNLKGIYFLDKGKLFLNNDFGMYASYFISENHRNIALVLYYMGTWKIIEG